MIFCEVKKPSDLNSEGFSICIENVFDYLTIRIDLIFDIFSKQFFVFFV